MLFYYQYLYLPLVSLRIPFLLEAAMHQSLKNPGIILLLCLLTLGGATGTVQASEQAAQAAEPYSLPDLYRLALTHAERIKLSEEELAIARQTKEKALAVLKPRVNGFGTYTRYSEKQEIEGSLVQPQSAYGWGIRADQSFTLNGRELIAFGIAKDGIEKNRYDLAAVQEDYLFSVASAFYDILKARRALEIAAANTGRLQGLRDAVAIRLALESTTKTDLFRAEAELSKAKTEQISAHNQLSLARAVLRRLVDVTREFEIVERETEDGREFSPDSLAEMKKEALAHRAEIKALALETRIAEQTVRFTKGDYWPTLSVEGLYVNSDQDPSTPFMVEDSLSAGVRLDVPLYDGGLRRANVSQSRSRQRQAELQLAAITRQIEVEVEQAYLLVTDLASAIASLEDQLKFARENFDAIAKLFKHGMADRLDVLDANTLLLTSESQISEARYSYRLALLGLSRAKGTFLNPLVKSQIANQGQLP
jgi:outer membrane protein